MGVKQHRFRVMSGSRHIMASAAGKYDRPTNPAPPSRRAFPRKRLCPASRRQLRGNREVVSAPPRHHRGWDLKRRSWRAGNVRLCGKLRTLRQARSCTEPLAPEDHGNGHIVTSHSNEYLRPATPGPCSGSARLYKTCTPGRPALHNRAPSAPCLIDTKRLNRKALMPWRQMYHALNDRAQHNYSPPSGHDARPAAAPLSCGVHAGRADTADAPLRGWQAVGKTGIVAQGLRNGRIGA